ncbi:MAG: exosortase/archaeosortase family protein [Candidatus Acidiferrum sp.]
MDALNQSAKYSPNPWVIYLSWAALCCLFFWRPLGVLFSYCLHNGNASHILLIPLITAALFYTERAKLSKSSMLDVRSALLFAVPAASLWAFSWWGASLQADVRLTLIVLSLVLFLVAGFVAIFGWSSAMKVQFPLAFLAFAIPMPEQLLNRVIYLLQAGSAAVAEQIFEWSGVPVLRDAFVFHLPGLSIAVAPECSGIRSSMALLILAVLLAHFAFSKFWKKVVFVGAGLAVMVVKNGVRIATLTILATYVNPDFLYGRLHHDGGVVFFLIGLVLLLPVFWLLRRSEPSARHSSARSSVHVAIGRARGYCP